MKWSLDVVFAVLAVLAPEAVAGSEAAAAPLGQVSKLGDCVAAPPAELAQRPARWLGACAAGRAQGPGVLRLGAREPYAFFLGRMADGKPVRGLVMDASGSYEAARAFDLANKAILADADHLREQDDAWALAAQGARNTAQRFSTVGNPASAAYYRRLAFKVTHDRPE